MKQTYQNGEIINVDFGKPPVEIKGHEQGFSRPCVVIKFFNNMRLAIVVPVTSKTPKTTYYTIVKLAKGIGNLTLDSYVLCH
jgi:mRNA-degrading endonuclease toxin of MazEF toxin-antitoxin module